MKNILEVFNNKANIAVDKDLVKRLHNYEQEFVHRNSDHIEFFGGNLLGVNKVRFLPSDLDKWFDDVLQIDDRELRIALHNLPSINKKFKVTSDVMNISCLWLCHAISKANLPEAIKHEGMINALLIFQYKVLTSRLSRDFKYTANKETMIAVYANMSLKYDIKQYGSWGALLKARAEDVISTTSIHKDAIWKFNNDKEILYCISDMQTRIRSIINNHWDIINSVMESDAKIVQTSSMISADQGLAMLDLHRSIPIYKDYLHTVVSEESNFIKDEIIKIVSVTMTTMPPVFLREALRYMSDQYLLDDGLVEKVIDDVIIHAFTSLKDDFTGAMKLPDMPFIIRKLRGIYQSSKSTDPILLDLRKNIDKMLLRKLKGRSPATLAAVRVGLMLYLVIRALAKKSYTG